MEALLECSRLSKRYGDSAVLEGLSFVLQRGECLALLGPSGCGKSTLLHAIAGALSPDGGTIRFDGVPLDDPVRRVRVPQHSRGFALVFQDFSLFPHLDVFENVAFGPRRKGLARGAVAASVAEALDLVAMGAFAKRRPGELSGGQQQRVALARALAAAPRLLLLDEPLSALDARLREELQLEISRLLRELALPCIFVTHDQAEALAVADRVALLRGGRIEQVADPRTLWERPATRFAAEFVGGANILEFSREGGVVRLAGGDVVALDAPFPRGAIALRKESTALRPAPLAGEIAIDAVCGRARFLGDRYVVEAETRGGILVRAYCSEPPRVGERLAACFAPASARFVES